MQFKDAAFEILKESGEPLHYNEITDNALAAGILTTTGQTPHSTMGSLLYTDTLKPNSRFRRGDKKGTFALRTAPPSDIEQQINQIEARVRKTLRDRLLKMDPRKFENLIQSLLDEMGLEETSVTSYGGDGGIDVRGVLNAEDLSKINIAVQAKRWKGNVGSKVVRELRGSLHVHEQGIVITPSNFTTRAKVEAEESGKTRISLIDGEQLINLLIQNQVGVIQKEYIVPVLDDDFWTEVLGDGIAGKEDHPSEVTPKESKTGSISFPLPIQATHKGKSYAAELIGLNGQVRYEGVIYQTPTTASKIIVTDWKEVNGWDFWRYFDRNENKWEKIGMLRK